MLRAGLGTAKKPWCVSLAAGWEEAGILSPGGQPGNGIGQKAVGTKGNRFYLALRWVTEAASAPFGPWWRWL